MITSLLHRIVAIPRVYDIVQKIASSDAMEALMRRKLDELGPLNSVVDIGGGTGLLREVVSNKGLYICLDIDPVKLKGYRDKYGDGGAVLADATAAPIRDCCIDVVICKCMSHHISNDAIESLIAECLRVLKPDGTLLFVDAVRNDRRLRSRILWRYDRGSYPRTTRELKSLIDGPGHVVQWDEVEYPLHQYVVCLARPKSV